MDARNPERFDRVEISDTGSVELIQQDDILPHVANAATARPADCRRQRARDAVALPDGLHGTPAETEDLATGPS
jgi:hypothetical protein